MFQDWGPNGVDVYGLTGNIGTGKSTVAQILHSCGIPIVFADEIARQVTARGTGELAEIVAAFGCDVLDERGELERRRLASRVFSDPGARRRLERILHPAILRKSRERFAELARGGHSSAVYESPLLFETGRHTEMEGVILVIAPVEVCIARVMARDGLTVEEVRARFAAQASEHEKRRLAGHLIENDGDLERLRSQVERLAAQLLRPAQGRMIP